MNRNELLDFVIKVEKERCTIIQGQIKLLQDTKKGGITKEEFHMTFASLEQCKILTGEIKSACLKLNDYLRDFENVD